ALSVVTAPSAQVRLPWVNSPFASNVRVPMIHSPSVLGSAEAANPYNRQVPTRSATVKRVVSEIVIGRAVPGLFANVVTVPPESVSEPPDWLNAPPLPLMRLSGPEVLIVHDAQVRVNWPLADNVPEIETGSATWF